MTEKKYEPFDLEESIMNVWNTKDDLNAITSRMLDDPDPMSEDEISNLLIGLAEMHNIRCKKLFDVFETMIHERCFTSQNDLKTADVWEERRGE